jgi:hypothetical protein
MNQAGNCSAKRITAGKKSSNTKNTEVSPGITKATLASRKAAETKLNDVDENGLNAHQRSAIKVAEVKSNKIDPVTGLNAHQVNGRKYSEWLDTSDGQLRRIELAKMASENQNKIDPTTGQKESKRRAKLMVDTKLSNIDENGLNGFERGHWNANGNTGFINGIYWQYSNERRFLERAVALGIINDVKRGPAVSYVFDGEERKYLSDFLIGDNKLFEVKSHYTMFGKNNEYLHKNIAKLSAAAKFGYEVFVVIDDETIPLSTFIGSVSHLLE